MTEAEAQVALMENVRLGYLEMNEDGSFSVTEAGRRRVELMNTKLESVKP